MNAPDFILDLWYAAPIPARDAAVTAFWLAPALLAGILATRGYEARQMTFALIRRSAGMNALFAGLVAVSVGVGVALIAQERALRQGTARAADRFDLVVAAPGDRIAMMLSAVYLQPNDAPLLRGDALARLQGDDRIDLFAPIAFGDSYDGAPIIGTTAAFAAHLSGGFVEGRAFETMDEAVLGALSPVAVGAAFTPVHGHGAVLGEAHDGVAIRAVGRMAATGSPWDRAILVPVEGVWATHGLATGHPPEAGDRIGPPFSPDHFPGTPSFVVATDELWEAYAVQAALNGPDMMAFFPGATLARLHMLLGDVREAMSLMAVVSQTLVAVGVLAGLVVLARLFARRFALLRALGAPRRFVFAVVWSYGAALLGAGCLLGLGVGWLAARAIAALVTARTDIAVAPALGFAELQLVAAFFSLTSLLAVLPAAAAYRRRVVDDLRSL